MIRGQGTAVSTLDHSATTPRTILGTATCSGAFCKEHASFVCVQTDNHCVPNMPHF